MWKYTELSYYLAALYYRTEDILDLLKKAGIEPQFVYFSYKATVFWTNIILYAERKKIVRELVQTVINDDHQDDPYLLAFQADENTSFKSPFSNRTLDLPVQPTENQLEKLTMGRPSFLPVSFLSQGVEKSKSVVKILTPDSAGSGFIIGNNYILTNNHVIDNPETARDTRTYFLCNYEDGQNEEEFLFAPDLGFATSKKNDWTVIRIDTSDPVKTSKLKSYQFLPLAPVEVKKDDFVNIIQHPEGKKKQIALYHNMVVGTDTARVQYLTDTLPGSSGSPVFNSRWEVVALHHAGGELQVKGTNKKELVNEGIHINLVLEEIKAAGINIV